MTMRFSEPTPEELRRLEETANQFRSACDERGYQVTGDDRIGEVEAAQLLGYQLSSFRNLRRAAFGPAHYNRRAGNSRISYRLVDLAEWVEFTRED